MTRFRVRHIAAFVLGGLALAAAPAGARTSKDAQQLSAGQRLPEGVTIQDAVMGSVFADSRGHTLYVRPMDFPTPGKSKCTNVKPTEGDVNDSQGMYKLPDLDKRRTCVDKWPPLLARPGFKPFGSWATIEREPGVRQLTYEGRPLYTSIKDQVPGTTNGGSGQDRRSVARPVHVPVNSPPGVQTVQARAAVIFRVGENFLFTPTKGPAKKNCQGECALTWRPFLTTMGQPIGEWTVVTRSDGTRQWAYRGQPVYMGPAAVNEAVKDAPSFTGEWVPIVYRRLPAPPRDVTVMRTNAGVTLTFATKEGKSLYYWQCSEATDDQLSCEDPGDTRVYINGLCGLPEVCSRNWKPYYASRGAKPVGEWTLIKANDPRVWIMPPNSKDERLVWAFRGRSVFTHAGDVKPGEFNGHASDLTRVSGIWLVQPHMD